MGNNDETDCNIKHIGRLQELGRAHYQQNFNITCNSGNGSVGMQCFTHLNDYTTKVYTQGKYLKQLRMY